MIALAVWYRRLECSVLEAALKFHEPSVAGSGFRVHHLGFSAHERRQVSASAAKLCVVLRGSLDTYIGGVAKPADVLFHPANRPIRVKTGKAGASTLSLDLDQAGADRFVEAGLDLNDARLVHCPSALLIAHRMREELVRRDRWTPVVLEGYVLQLMVAAFRRGEKLAQIPAWLRRVQERLVTDCVSRRHLADYAQEAGVHPMHLARAFRQYVGMSVGEQIRTERVKRAAALLTATNQSLADVATCVGFCDQGHLARQFKRVLGVSPSAYRRTYRDQKDARRE
jgi:AraC family transcriptional regulator